MGRGAERAWHRDADARAGGGVRERTGAGVGAGMGAGIGAGMGDGAGGGRGAGRPSAKRESG